MWYLYIVKCKDGTLYTGITTDISERIDRHNRKKASKYTRVRTPVKLIYEETHRTRSAALKRELFIKSLTRSDKLKLVASRKKRK
ncbi:MAG: GIY-YIG nuclease family protein [Candidatus Omnitrophica bacterium]|nr:GIY-YIG nuclease family protein [Candidatus Omnitrophota bacterium]